MWPYLHWKEAEGACWLEQLHLFQTGPFVIQSMTLSLVGLHLLTLHYVLSCQTCWTHCSTVLWMVLWPLVGFIRRKRKECWSTAQPSVRLFITQHSNHSRGVLLSPTNSSQLYRTTAKCYGDLIQTTVKEIPKQLNKYDTSRKGHRNVGGKDWYHFDSPPFTTDVFLLFSPFLLLEKKRKNI